MGNGSFDYTASSARASFRSSMGTDSFDHDRAARSGRAPKLHDTSSQDRLFDFKSSTLLIKKLLKRKKPLMTRHVSKISVTKLRILSLSVNKDWKMLVESTSKN